MSRKLGLVFLVFLVPAEPIIVPGSCPQVPATQFYLKSKFSFRNLILGVPFSKSHRSHLFQNISVTEASAFWILIDPGITGIDLQFPGENPKVYSRNTISYDKRNGIMKIKSSVFAFSEEDSETVELKCWDTLKENIRIWEDDNFILISSCRDMGPHKGHDQAVLFIATNVWNGSYFQNGNLEKFHEMMKTLKVTSKKYLSNLLINEINWKPNMSVEERFVKNPFLCPVDLNVKRDFDLITILVIYVAILCSFVVGIFGCFEYFSSNSKPKIESWIPVFWIE